MLSEHVHVVIVALLQGGKDSAGPHCSRFQTEFISTFNDISATNLLGPPEATSEILNFTDFLRDKPPYPPPPPPRSSVLHMIGSFPSPTKIPA